MPEHWCICGEHTQDVGSTVGLQIRTGTSTSHTCVFNNSEKSQGHIFDVCCEGYRPRGDEEGQIRQAKGSKTSDQKKCNILSNWLIKGPSLRLGVWYGRPSQWGSIITGPMESHSGSAGAGGQGLAATRPCRKWWRVSRRTRLPTRIYDAWVKARQPWIVKSPIFIFYHISTGLWSGQRVSSNSANCENKSSVQCFWKEFHPREPTESRSSRCTKHV